MWSESRSRDEWLAEVKRRGERIRRRRRMAVTVVTVLALFLPLSALAGFLTADPASEQELSVAGPAPAGAVVPGTIVEGPGAVVAVDEQPPANSTSTTEIQRKAEPTQTRTAPAVDDPVVRAPTTTTTRSETGNAPSPDASPSTTIQAPTGPPTRPCTPAEVQLTSTSEKDTYQPGERARGSAAVERRPGANCFVFDFSEFQILNSAGKNVVPSGSDMEFRTYTSSGADGGPALASTSFAWEAIDCTPQRLSPLVLAPGDRTGCVPFPPGTYTAVSQWGDTTLFVRIAFQLTA